MISDKTIAKAAAGFLCWLLLLLFIGLENSAVADFILIASLIVVFVAVLPTPCFLKETRQSQRSKPSNENPIEAAEHLIAEAEHEATRLQEIRDRYGDDLADQVEELLRQKQAIARMEVQP